MNLDNLDSKLNNKVAILICGHGSRNKLAISEFQELQEPLYEKLEEIVADGCDGEGNVVKWSGGCVTWSGGYIQDGEETDIFVRYGS